MPVIIRAQAKVNNLLGLAAALLIALALKLSLLLANALPFNSDEAVVALMARHILRGERPLFFYGQAYMGSLDAYLVAGGFALFGEHVWVARAVQVALYLITLSLIYIFVWRAFRSSRMAVMAALFMALPAVNLTLYTTVSLGGYGEALLIGALTMLLGLPSASGRVGPLRSLVLGLLLGIGLWVFPLSLTMSLPALLVLVWFAKRTMRWRDLAACVGIGLVGAWLGMRPWVVSYELLGQSAVTELLGGAIAGTGAATAWGAIGPRLANLLVFGSTVVAGIRPPWGIRWLFWPFAPVAIAFLLATIAYGIVKLRDRSEAAPARWMVAGAAALVCIAFVLTPFGGDPSGRYFLPLGVCLAIGGADMLEGLWRARPRWAMAVLAGDLVFNLGATIQCAQANPPGLTTQFDPVAQVDTRALPELIAFLRAQGETRGFTNYWVEYPLAFHSGEELVFVARLPYHEDMRYTARDDRYAPYDDLVAASERVAYITTRHPTLDSLLRKEFESRGIAFQEKQIGEYHVFYALSARLAPSDLGVK
jgi:4-amino-4-deoxy-L-arabinose transferase-like glycosyltransferase